MKIYKISEEEWMGIKGKWEGWGDVTLSDRQELADWFRQYVEKTKRYYTKELAEPKVYIYERIIKEIETSTSIIDAAKLMSRLSMEERMDLNDSIPVFSGAYKAFGKLLDFGGQFIKQFKPQEPDIVLNNAAETLDKDGNKQMESVEIFGLEDGKPRVSIGYSYKWDLSVLENKDSLLLDAGRGYAVVGLRNLVPVIKNKIDEWNRANEFY